MEANPGLHHAHMDQWKKGQHQNKLHEKERPVLWPNSLLLQLLCMLWLKSAYTYGCS